MIEYAHEKADQRTCNCGWQGATSTWDDHMVAVRADQLERLIRLLDAKLSKR